MENIINIDDTDVLSSMSETSSKTSTKKLKKIIKKDN